MLCKKAVSGVEKLGFAFSYGGTIKICVTKGRGAIPGLSI
jgi:hypothetical protein